MGKSEGGMWHEARKQEKKIRVMMVDYKRRADRRRQYYERIKQDPTQFLRVYGRPCKIHWESSVALAADGPQSMMPWQGDPSINIDRFDVRSHLDLYQEPKNTEEELTKEQEEEERQCNFERYRILVQNDCAGVPEDLCLRQIHIDELYGALETTNPEEEKKNRLADKKAAIAYTYEDSTDKKPVKEEKVKEEEEEMEDSEDSDFEMDLDNTVDIYNITIEQAEMLNAGSIEYGMAGQDYADNLMLDKDEAEALKLAKIMEEEKAQFSGRRSRRERRAFKEKRMKDRTNSPPSYAAKESPKHELFKKGRSSSRSRSKSPPTGPEQFSFISSFGADGEEGVVQGPMLPPHLLPQSVRNKVLPTRSRRSRSRSTSRERAGRLSSKATKRIGHLKALRGKSSPSRSLSRSRSKSRSRSPRRARSRSPRRARSRSRDRRRGRYYHSRSRSRSRNRHYSRRSRSSTRSRGRSSRSRRSRSYSRSRRSYSRSRSYSSRSRSRSRSSSYSRSKSRSYSRSPSKSPEKEIAPIVKRYRRDSLSSKSSDMEDSEDDAKVQTTSTKSSRLSLPKLPGKKESAQTKLTAADKMKLKMQKALKRQLKADILARHEKEVKITQERQDREDELRAIAIQMRRREREKRHKDVGDSDPEDTPVKRRSKSRSRSPKRTLKRSRSPSRTSKDRDHESERDRHRDRDTDNRRDDRARSGRPPPPIERRPDPPREWRGGRDDRDVRFARDRRESWSRGDPRDSRESRYDGRGPRESRDSYGGRGPRDGRGDSRDGTNGQGYRSSQGYQSKRRSPSPPPRAKLVDY